MALATIQDLKRLLDVAPPGEEQPKITIGSDGNLGTEEAKAYLDAQEGYIIARLGFTPADNAFTREIHGKLTAFHVWIHIIDQSAGAGEIPDYVMEWKTWAEDCLTKAREGELAITPLDEAPSISSYSSEFRQVESEQRIMKANDWRPLENSPIVAKSELVYSAEYKAGTLFVRGTDYEINYVQGEIKAISGGGISDDQAVYVTYIHLSTRPFRKIPDRVESKDRAGTENWGGLFKETEEASGY